jgi:hypothetical protein
MTKDKMQVNRIRESIANVQNIVEKGWIVEAESADCN